MGLTIAVRCKRRYFAVDRGQVEPLISVDGWLSGLDFDGFADLTFEPVFLSGDRQTSGH